jgi:hypothetical protein
LSSFNPSRCQSSWPVTTGSWPPITHTHTHTHTHPCSLMHALFCELWCTQDIHEEGSSNFPFQIHQPHLRIPTTVPILCQMTRGCSGWDPCPELADPTFALGNNQRGPGRQENF